MSVLEPPIERLNYFNGERLDARDFRAESDYQIRVRRLVNHWLFSPGIARGLEVTRDPNDTHKVRVGTGLAFDFMGREIIVLEQTAVPVYGVPSTTPGYVLGNFLVVSYVEERGEPSNEAGCRVTAGSCGCTISWNGPTRIREGVKFEVVDTWPTEASGRIVLAQLELAKGCEVAGIYSKVRKYALPIKPAKVRAVSLEGEKDIDKDNAKRLLFHVDGSYPDAVTLHLRASKFSSLYYTELGKHTHTLTASATTQNKNLAHTHQLTADAKTDKTGLHQHDYYTDAAEQKGGIELHDTQDRASNRRNQDNSAIIPAGEHEHIVKTLALDKGTFDDGVSNFNHTHTITATAADTGVTDVSTRTGQSWQYVNDLHIWFDGVDITSGVLQQLAGRDPVKWPIGSKLGNGTATHVLVTEGTKDLDLLQLVDDCGPGEHTLEFKVLSGGGQVHYNLYVE
jgi:hypothetical protein